MGQSQSDRPELRLLPVDSVNERQRLVINRMLNGFEGFLSTSKYAKLAKCSTDTALRDIRELLQRGIVVQNSSGGRSTSYRLGDPDDVRD
jgi:Fic family protein